MYNLKILKEEVEMLKKPWAGMLPDTMTDEEAMEEIENQELGERREYAD